jgi:hypothetical protein
VYYQPPPPLQGLILGGFSGNSGASGDYLQNGWIAAAGFIWWADPYRQLGLRTDLSNSYDAANHQYLASEGMFTHGWGDFTTLSTGLQYRPPLLSWPRLYVLAQVGVTHTRLWLSESLSDNGYYCDPYYYYCSYGPSTTISDENANSFSWNVGVGLDFPLYRGNSLFVEAQFRRIQMTPPLDYWPITVGLRF